jgi:hypothetical protein
MIPYFLRKTFVSFLNNVPQNLAASQQHSLEGIQHKFAQIPCLLQEACYEGEETRELYPTLL